MNPLDAWRRELTGLIPDGFLRRDRLAAYLLVSDYPARCESPENITRALETAGYTVTLQNGLAHLDGTEEKYQSLLSSLPALPLPPLTEENAALALLAGRILRTGGEENDLPFLRFTLKCLDAGDEQALLAGLPPMIAVLQRQKKKPPLGAAGLILCYLERSAGPC